MCASWRTLVFREAHAPSPAGLSNQLTWSCSRLSGSLSSKPRRTSKQVPGHTGTVQHQLLMSWVGAGDTNRRIVPIRVFRGNRPNVPPCAIPVRFPSAHLTERLDSASAGCHSDQDTTGSGSRLIPSLLRIYWSIARAAFLPAPIAVMTVAAPVTASPPA